MPSKEEYQFPTDNVATLTSKSSGIDYKKYSSTMEPRQDSLVEKREPVTKNEK